MKKFFIVFIFLFLPLLLLSCEQECRHDNMTESIVEPTCTENGQTVYTCLDCGYTYLDKIIDPVGHSFEKNAVSADCTNDGYTENVCACGYSYISDIISAVGHDYVDIVKAADCINGGYTTHICKICDYSYISNHTDPAGHKLTETVISPTCTEDGYTVYDCEDCEYTYTLLSSPPTGHIFNEETVTAVSCTERGEIRYYCDCGESYSSIIPPTGHDFLRAVTMPTLSDMGYTEFKCQNDGCDFEYTGDIRFYSDILKCAYAKNSEILARGIDISHHQYKADDNGYISLDWERIKDYGIEYAIIRVGEAAIGIDPTFEKSYADARAAGLDVGAYFYTRATSVDEIRREAYLVLSALDGKKFEYPIYLDLEDESLMGIDSGLINEMCIEFFTILQRSGYYTGLYLNHEWLNNVVDTKTALSRFEIWYARYPALADGEEYVWKDAEYGEHLGMWQYTDKGIIDGIDTVFDFNFAYKDYPAIITQGGFNGYESDVKFPDTGRSFVWVTHSGDIKVRSSSDYFTTDGYDAEADIIGYAGSRERFEIIEHTDKYTAINYKGQVAYITANPLYVSFKGLLVTQ